MATHYHLEMVDARLAEEAEQIVTPNGVTHVEPGQWIVARPGVGSTVMDQDAFDERYSTYDRDDAPEEWKPAKQTATKRTTK